MSVLSDNIRYLRANRGYSQQKVADELCISRARYAKYEDAKSEPPLDILITISHYYHVSIDLLVSIDLRRVPMEKILKLDDNRLLLPITVDHKGENFIEIIPHKAKAGYLTGYSDPEFIEGLQVISLPFLRNGKYRAFPVDGDSMPPHNDGSLIVGRYMEKPEIKSGRTYVFLTQNEGITYKRVKSHDGASLLLSSDNEFYQPYAVHLSEIIEIWEFACSIATTDFQPENLSRENITGMFMEIRKGITDLKKHQNFKPH